VLPVRASAREANSTIHVGVNGAERANPVHPFAAGAVCANLERTGLPRSTHQAIRVGRRPQARNAKLIAAAAKPSQQHEGPPIGEVTAESHA